MKYSKNLFGKPAMITVALILCTFQAFGQVPEFHTGNILPFQSDHVHASTIVQLSNGDLLVAWFQGSGERQSDDVKIFGARKKYGSNKWSPPFVMADVKGFPDINPVLFIDGKHRLWLMWYTVLANQWETSLLKYRISEHYLDMLGAPQWNWQADLHVKFGNTDHGIQPNDPFVQSVKKQLAIYKKTYTSSKHHISYKKWKSHILARAEGKKLVKQGRIYRKDGTYKHAQLGYPLFRRIGWQTRNKPFITKSGRLILPLYSDGFSFSVMVYTDNWGKTWKFSNPLVGAGNIQPTIAKTTSGMLVAYMRDNGPAPKRLHVSHSTDEGETWSPVKDSSLPNPGSAADIVTLKNGDWVLAYNDTKKGRNSLAVAISPNDGKSWPWKKKIEYDTSKNPKTASYPAIIQGRKGNIYLTYSFHKPSGGNKRRQTIKFAEFNEAWIKTK